MYNGTIVIACYKQPEKYVGIPHKVAIMQFFTVLVLRFLTLYIIP